MQINNIYRNERNRTTILGFHHVLGAV